MSYILNKCIIHATKTSNISAVAQFMSYNKSNLAAIPNEVGNSLKVINGLCLC